VLHHVCIVVSDIAKSVRYYESIGVGPWTDYPPLDNIDRELLMPDLDGFFETQFKFARLANVQLLLCQPGAGRSPQRVFLDTHGEGVFHLAFQTQDCDASEESAKSAGLVPFMRGRRSDGSGFTYFDSAAEAGIVLEIRADAHQASET
jgi:methylmalonyl-CoA/ethylmalonyl-CoA epimerase